QPYDYGAIQPYNADPAATTYVQSDPNALVDPNQQYMYTDPNQQALDPYYGYETTTITPRRKPPFLLIGIVIVLLVVLVLLFLLISSRARNNTPNNNQNNTGRNIILQWWGAYLDPDVVKPLIDEYQSLNPNVKIEYANK